MRNTTGALYSPVHDQGKNPSSRRPRRPRRRGASESAPVLGSPPEVQAGILPPVLSDERRRELRARQLIADSERPHGHQVLPDHDVDFDPDLEVRDPRGEYFNQESGPVNTIFPVVNGPQFTHTKTRILPESSVHPGLPDFSRRTEISASSQLIAAVSADDKDILEVDNKLTQVHSDLVGLRQAVQRMRQSVSQQDDDPRQEGSATDHASNMYQMLTTIIEPWFGALESEFSDLLDGTVQHSELDQETI